MPQRKKPTSIFVDGSPIGIGAVLTQKDVSTNEVTPLHYASSPLTPIQARYPQIDREALSVYWAVKRSHLFIYGGEFKVITDHQPLVSLFNNPTSKPSTRIERWLMELQQYRFTVEYHPGASNPADYASRHPGGDWEQLTCTDTAMLKSDHLVVPASLQERIVDIAHEGHLDIVKTKALLREKVWFPCMDKMVETKVKACLPCQVVTPL